jgi:tetratricopeptide (TPR) repeat protein
MSIRMDAHLTWPVCLICLTAMALFCSGCAQQQDKAVDLYVDAVMYKEFQQNDLAIEKLNSAVKENKKFSLAYSLLGDIYQEMKEYEKSANSYEMAAELNPWSFRDYFSLGKVYEIMEKCRKGL